MDSVLDKYTLFQISRELKTTQNVLILQWCSTLVDYTEHFFFDSLTIPKFWNHTEQYLLTTFDIQIHLTVADALFGINILMAKMCTSVYKKTNASFHCPWYLKISSGSEMFNCGKA